jgi:predicted regulator of Ras-like GTPase activity (Roadblock/LC7/MglB family)
MAGRKPPSEGNFFSTLLGKLRLGDPAEPQPAPKKGKRRRKARPSEGAPALYASDIGETGNVSPFAEYDAQGGLMDLGQPNGFDDALNYEAAAAAGFAPVPMTGGPTQPATQPESTTLPSFGATETRAVTSPARPLPAGVAETAVGGGRLFTDEALDNSLDALFLGLETGTLPPPIPSIQPTPLSLEKPPADPGRTSTERPLFDEFGLTPPTPVAPQEAAPPAGGEVLTPGQPWVRGGLHTQRPIHKPIVQPATSEPVAGTPAFTPGTTAQARDGGLQPDQVPRVSQLASPTAPVPPPPGGPAARGGIDGYRMAPPTVLALAEGVNLNVLLAGLDAMAGVAGAVLVGYDGLIIATQLPPELDADYLGAQACSLFAGTNTQLGKMKRGELRRILLETGSGAMLLTAADMGILVVVSHEGRAMDIAGIMEAIEKALPA